MKIIDAYRLARTKRKTRRIRTALVIMVSGLLFSVLFFGAFVGAGVVQSVQQVKDVGFNSRYLVNVMSVGKTEFDFGAFEKKLLADMDAELRARGIAVTDSTRQDPSYMEERMRRIEKFFDEEAVKTQVLFDEKVKTFGNPIAQYKFRGTGAQTNLTFQKDFTTDPKVQAIEAEAREQKFDDPSPLASAQFYQVEQDMLRTQLAPGQSFDWQPGQPVPIIMSYTNLEKLAGKSFANLDTATRNQGYRDMITAYSGKVLDYCYRNAAADQQLRDVVAYNEQVAKDSDVKTNPIAIPVCADFDQALLKKLGITREASADDPKPLFTPPTLPPAATSRIQFKIVGYMPSQNPFEQNNALVRAFLEANSLQGLENPIIVPSEVSAVDQRFAPQTGRFGGPAFALYDFANREDQKAFLAHGCKGMECADSAKPWMMTFGNLSVTLESVFIVASTALVVGVIAIMIIAALMMLFTISKVIADSTKEIAVFRALGARRRDIAQIYYTYGGMLAVSAAVFAVVIGVIGAIVIHMLVGDQFASMLVSVVGAYTLNPSLGLIGFDIVWSLGVAAALCAAAFVGITIPIGAAIKRKLITMLREE